MTDKIAVTLLSPEFQESFWSNLDPDLRGFLEAYESREDWTYEYNEIPKLFVDLSNALPRFAMLPPTKDHNNILRQLIPILTSMPLRQAICAIAWLDNQITNDEDMGWGVVCFLEAARIFQEAPDDEIYSDAKVLYERVGIVLKTRLSTFLFTNIEPMRKAL